MQITLPVLLSVLGGLITVILGFVVARLAGVPKLIAVGAVCGGILALAGGVLLGFEASEKTEEIAGLAQENSKLSKRIAELAEANVRLNEHINNSVTGGDSFCYYMLSSLENSNSLERLLVHFGEFPIYNLYIRIIDCNKVDEIQKKYKRQDLRMIRELQYEATETIRRGTLVKAGLGNIAADPIELFRLPSHADKQEYKIFFTARNGSWSQQVLLRRVNDKWTWATRVTRIDGVLRVYVSRDFPRDDKGEVNW